MAPNVRTDRTGAVAPTRRLRTVAIVLAIALGVMLGGVGLFAAGPASAAGIVDVSSDGVTYGATFPGALFEDIGIHVPGDSQATSFYVRNSGTQTGFLRVALANVSVSDAVLGTALTVVASTAGYPGTPAALNQAQPCRVLTEGELVPAGGVVMVDTALMLGNLNGQQGQGGTATVSLRVSLSDAAIGSLPPTSCGALATTILVVGPGQPVVTGTDTGMAMTGTELPVPLIAANASLIGAGLFLLLAARRRRRAKQ